MLFNFLPSINLTRWALEVRWNDDAISYDPTASEAIIDMTIKEIMSLRIEPQPPALYLIVLPTELSIKMENASTFMRLVN